MHGIPLRRATIGIAIIAAVSAVAIVDTLPRTAEYYCAAMIASNAARCAMTERPSAS